MSLRPEGTRGRCARTSRREWSAEPVGRGITWGRCSAASARGAAGFASSTRRGQRCSAQAAVDGRRDDRYPRDHLRAHRRSRGRHRGLVNSLGGPEAGKVQPGAGRLLLTAPNKEGWTRNRCAGSGPIRCASSIEEPRRHGGRRQRPQDHDELTKTRRRTSRGCVAADRARGQARRSSRGWCAGSTTTRRTMFEIKTHAGELGRAERRRGRRALQQPGRVAGRPGHAR